MQSRITSLGNPKVTANNISRMSNTPKILMHEYIHESNLIEGYDDPYFDKQSMIDWKYLSKQTELSYSVICKTQKLITLCQKDLRPDWRGYYRSIDVTVGGRFCPMAIIVPTMMNKWLDEYPDREPVQNHILFEKVHPFVDGNGRTGRMLMWWQEIKLGRKPTLYSAAFRRDYYKIFE